MPCRTCGGSAKRHGGACFGLSYDEDGTARYTCLTCALESVDE